MSQSFTVELSWPRSELWPNDRSSRRERANAVASYRHACCVETKVAMRGRTVKNPKGEFVLDLEFRPPPKRRPDVDNCVAAAKAAIDGLADGLGVNDRQFQLGAVTIGAAQPWGLVAVRVSEAAEWRCSKCEGQHEPKWPCPYDQKTGSAARGGAQPAASNVETSRAAGHITSTDR